MLQNVSPSLAFDHLSGSTQKKNKYTPGRNNSKPKDCAGVADFQQFCGNNNERLDSFQKQASALSQLLCHSRIRGLGHVHVQICVMIYDMLSLHNNLSTP